MFKKIILAAVLAASAVFAQLPISVGGHAAFSYGTAWGDHSGDLAGWVAGFNAGVAAKVSLPLISVVSLLEVGYRRFSGKDGLRDNPVKVDVSLTYLEIPVLARISVLPLIFVDAGVSLGFNLSTTAEVEIFGMPLDFEIPSEAKNTVEFGILAGFGATVLPNLEVNARFALGLTDMADVAKIINLEKDEDEAEFPKVGFKNMRFQIGATYWFI